MDAEHEAGMQHVTILEPVTVGMVPMRKLQESHLHLHHARVSRMAGFLASVLGYSHAEAATIGFAGASHDIGKLYISSISDVLHQPRAMTPNERQMMEMHTCWGAALLRRVGDSEIAAQVAMEHHERWDGSGYPRGLVGDQICRAARIVSMCDVYDALRDVRPYKPALSHAEAVGVLRQPEVATGFEPEVLNAFLRHHLAFAEIFDMQYSLR